MYLQELNIYYLEMDKIRQEEFIELACSHFKINKKRFSLYIEKLNPLILNGNKSGEHYYRLSDNYNMTIPQLIEKFKLNSQQTKLQ